MKQVVLNVPDNKYPFFMELVKSLGFVKVSGEPKLTEKEEGILEIPKTHQKLVMDRFNKVRKDPDSLLDWDEAKKTLKA